MAGKSLDDVKTQQDVKWEQDIIFLEMPRATEFYKVRIVGSFFPFSRHWILTNPADEMKSKKYPRECTNFNMESERSDLDKGCPACEKELRAGKQYLVNVIDREVQENGAKNPIKCLGPLPVTAINKIIQLKKMNKRKQPDGTSTLYHVTDEENGCDICIMFDNNKQGVDKWNVQLDGDGKVPLTAIEKKYRLHDFESIYYPHVGGTTDEAKQTVEDYNQQTRESMTRQGYFGKPKKKVEMEDEEDAPSSEPPAKLVNMSRKPVAAAPARKPVVEEDDVEDVEVIKTVTKVTPVEKTQASAKIATSPKKAVVGDASANSCPHEDDDHKFGSFVGDMTCMRCVNKQACIAATNDD